jgi:hypothetical protein
VVPSIALASFALLAAHGAEKSATVLTMTRVTGSSDSPGDAKELRRDGRPIGVLRHTDSRQILDAGSVRASVERSEQAVRPGPGQAYPRRIVSDGQLEGSTAHVRQEYVLLAPPAPIGIEGLGVELETDPPGKNAAEHRQLRAWLESQGLASDTRPFEELHAADAGRDMRVWYEVSGRRVDGTVEMTGPAPKEARFDSLFHVTADGWRIHHARELWYHRESLELVDTLRGPSRDGQPMDLRSFECGCYGWAIGGDWVSLGPQLYHVKVVWENHRVGAGLFLGLEERPGFPWIGMGDREKMALLARRAGAYQLTDAHDALVAEITVDAPNDVPGGVPGPATYEVRVATDDGSMQRLALLGFSPEEIRAELHPLGDRPPLEQLDTLLAAMPTQVLRGDGIRDSHLGTIETMLDWFRLVQKPSDEVLSDVVSEIDALAAVEKVHILLAEEPTRFAPKEEDVPPAPGRHPKSPFSS